MRKALMIMMASLLFLSCANGIAKRGVALKDYQTAVEQTEPDTVVQRKAKGAGNDDNMRGFDPASEDDLTDNGMSCYMENNDNEGWE